jgi:hypothetical protein
MAATARPRWVAVRRCMTDISSSSVVSTLLWTPGRGVPGATASSPGSPRGRPSPLCRRTDGERIRTKWLAMHAASPPGGSTRQSDVVCDQRRSVIRGPGECWIIRAARTCRDGVPREEGARSGKAWRSRRNPRRTRPLTVPKGPRTTCAVAAPTPARRESTPVLAKAAPAQPKPSRLWLGGRGRGVELVGKMEA